MQRTSCAFRYRSVNERHELAPVEAQRPCPRSGETALKALVAGMCIFAVALVASVAVAASFAVTAAPAAAAAPPKAAVKVDRKKVLHTRLAQRRHAARKAHSTIAFFRSHPRILSSEGSGPHARRVLAVASQRLADAEDDIDAIERELRRIELVRQAQMSTPEVICEVFGRYCRQALAVSWCESRHSVNARNGQYLGLFQMGSSERSRFGHGPNAWDQARAAYQYFMLSGHDWSPWSCRPW